MKLWINTWAGMNSSLKKFVSPIHSLFYTAFSYFFVLFVTFFLSLLSFRVHCLQLPVYFCAKLFFEIIFSIQTIFFSFWPCFLIFFTVAIFGSLLLFLSWINWELQRLRWWVTVWAGQWACRWRSSIPPEYPKWSWSVLQSLAPRSHSYSSSSECVRLLPSSITIFGA